MIKSITATNYLGESIELELGFPEKSGFLIQNIEGLGPIKANIKLTDFSGNDGSIFNSARAITRNIVISLIFLFKPTIEDTRQLSYKYFPIKKPILLKFETDNRISEALGYVESNEPNIFSDQEGTQISIICPNPYLHTRATPTVFSGIESLFEFPFYNDSLDENLLEMSNTKSDTVDTIYYHGDADVGIVITIHTLGPASNISIYNTDTREMMSIATDKITEIVGSPIKAGDDIIISTVNGSKKVFFLREGEYFNIFNAIDKNSDWFQLSSGPNTFAYTATTGVNNLEFSIENEILYEGI